MRLSPHGLEVVRQVAEAGKLNEFIQMWRTAFLEDNKPQFLPKGWRIDHKTVRDFGDHSKFKNLDKI